MENEKIEFKISPYQLKQNELFSKILPLLEGLTYKEIETLLNRINAHALGYCILINEKDYNNDLQ